MKNGRVLGQYARLQFHKSLDNKSGPEKAKMYNANCRYVQVNTVLWCMSNDLQCIDGKKRIFLQFVRRGEFHMGWM